MSFVFNIDKRYTIIIIEIEKDDIHKYNTYIIYQVDKSLRKKKKKSFSKTR
jgi:hypothetical protein